MFWLEIRDVKFGLITLAVMFALLFTGCKRRGKIEKKEVLTVELLRRLTAFFIFAGMICNCSEMLLDHFNVALDKKLAYYETRYFALIHLRLLYVLSPVFAGGSMFFAGAYCFKYPFHRCDSIKKARIGLYFLIMAFFGSFRYVICTNTPVYPYAAHVTYADLAKILMDILARPFMGVVPIIFILSMLYIILRKVIVNENVLLGLVTAASVGLSLVMFQTRVDNICWRPYAILFALGMFFVRYEEKLLRILAKLYAAVVPVAAILLCGSVFQEVMFYINRKKLRDNPFIRLAPFVDKMDYHKIIVFP